MLALQRMPALVLHALEILGVFSSKISTISNSSGMDCYGGCSVVTDLTIGFCPRTDSPFICSLDPQTWRHIEKELYSHMAQRNAWLHLAQKKEKDLAPGDQVITDIKIGKPHDGLNSNTSWESRPGGIWVLRNKYTAAGGYAVTGVDVLFGTDAVDPRPHWSLMESPLELNASSEVPVARLSVRYGRTKPNPDHHRQTLRAREDGKFKIVQISDTHFVTGIGVCKDAIDAHGRYLPESEADPLAVEFLSGTLDVEKPDLVILSGDQVHHDVPDTQSALFKVVAPLIERSIPYAAVFGNHDAEGAYALSRE